MTYENVDLNAWGDAVYYATAQIVFRMQCMDRNGKREWPDEIGDEPTVREWVAFESYLMHPPSPKEREGYIKLRNFLLDYPELLDEFDVPEDAYSTSGKPPLPN